MIGDREVGKQCAGLPRWRKADILAIAEHGKVTQHADFQRCILFIGHFCQRHSQPPLLTNAPQRSYCILYNSLVRRYRRSKTELLTGPAKLRPDRVPANQFIICGAVSRRNAQCAVARSGRYLNFSTQDCSAARTVGNPKTDRKVGQMAFRMPKMSLDSAPDLHCSEPLEQVLLCYAAEFAFF